VGGGLTAIHIFFKEVQEMNNMQPQPWAPMAQQTQNLLPAQPNHPFYYKWHPSNWQFVYNEVQVQSGKSTKTVKKGFFIPHLRMERVVPGVNGVHQIQGEMGNPGSRIGQLQQQGWIYFDPQKYDYMHVYQVRGGRYHVPKWTNIKVVAKRLIEKMDTAEFQVWCVNLLRSNMLGTPEPHFWELSVHERNSGRAMETLLKQQHVPEKRQELDELKQTIQDMKDFIQEYETVGMSIYEDFVK
jgi:hypothetical protein